MNTKINLIERKDGKGFGLPVFCIIPGGPGLSSQTLRGAEELSRLFDIGLIDPPGTGGQEEVDNVSFVMVLESIEWALQGLGRKVILAGHSYGGVFAAEIALRGRVLTSGLVLMAAPARAETMVDIQREYRKHVTGELLKRRDEWLASPSLDTFRQWLASYGKLYFRSSEDELGKRMLLQDMASYKTFLGVREGWHPDTDYDSRVRELAIKKLMISGQMDVFVRSEYLMRDAEILGCSFYEVPDAAHFLIFDQPSILASIIEENFCLGGTEQ